MYITLHATLVTLKFFPSTINPCVYDTDAATINSFKNRHEIRRKCQMDIVRLNVYKSLGCTRVGVLDLWWMIDDLGDCTRCSCTRCANASLPCDCIVQWIKPCVHNFNTIWLWLPTKVSFSFLVN